MSFLTIEKQVEFFAGVSIVGLSKACLPDGKVLDRKRFNVMYGGHTFARDETNQYFTYSAFVALTNLRYRRP